MAKFTPSGTPTATSNTTEGQFIALIANGHLHSLAALEALIPSDQPTKWVANPEDHIQYGLKYEWKEAGQRRMVRIHESDLKSPSDSNSTMGWIVRVQVGNRHLAAHAQPIFVGNATTVANANATHVPVKRGVSNMTKLHESIQDILQNTERTTSKKELSERIKSLTDQL